MTLMHQRMIKVIFATLCSLVCGVLIMTMVLQQEAWFIQCVERRLIASFTEYLPHMHCTVESINILTGKVVIKELEAHAEDHSWSLDNKMLIVEFSPLDLLVRQTLHAQFIITDLHLMSVRKDGQVAFMKPIELFMQAPSMIPFELRSITLRRARIELIEQDHNITATFAISTDTCIQKEMVKNNVAIQDGTIAFAGKKRITRMQGTAQCTYSSADGSWKVNAYTSQQLPDLPDASQLCHMHFDYDHDSKFSFASQDRAFSLKAVMPSGSPLTYSGQLQLDQLVGIPGSLFFDGRIDSNEYRAELRCHDVSVLKPINKLIVTVNPHDGKYDGQINLYDQSAVKQRIEAHLSDNKIIFTSAGDWPALHGSITYQAEGIIAELLSGQEQIMHCWYNKTGKFGIRIPSTPIAYLLKQLYDFELQGTGALIIKGKQLEDHYQGTLQLQQGSIKIPSIYNALKECTGHWIFDTVNKRVLVTDLSMQLHTGTILIPQASYYWNRSFMMIPMQLHGCLANWGKVYFGLVSGYGIIEYRPRGFLVGAQLRVDKSYVKLNNLQESSTLEESNMPPFLRKNTYPVQLDIHLHTHKPAKINTNYFKTEASGSLAFAGSLGQVQITGAIMGNGGTLNLPYKPLYIKEAKLLFSPGETTNATLELVAQNTIKKHSVELRVSGPLFAPHITLSSSPTLQEEQILTLLLSGSLDGSLVGAMPHMMVQGLQMMLFSTENKTDWLQAFKNVLKPLGNIRIQPAIIDKQNQPVKGGFAIDINDTLTASIANNLDLTDEPSVEVEYALSEGTTLRGIRDDKGSMSGEIEVRWKF